MATEDTVSLSPSHAPHQASLDAFASILDSVKHELVKLRHDHDKHEPQYFSRISHLSDASLISFTPNDLVAVRVASSAYGLHLFGKVRIPTVEDGDGAYVHIRVFGSAKEGTDGSELEEREYKLHSIHTEEVVKADGDRVYRAVFGEGDELEWFDT